MFRAKLNSMNSELTRDSVVNDQSIGGIKSIILFLLIIVSSSQVFCQIGLKNKQYWWGLYSADQDSSAVNTELFSQIWEDAGQISTSEGDGYEIYVPEGVFWTNYLDLTSDPAKFANLIGAGQRMSVFRLNEGEQLLKTKEWFNSGIRDVGFWGNSQNSKALVELNWPLYNFNLNRVYLKSSAVGGLKIGGTNDLTMIDVESELNSGWGIEINGGIGVNMFGVTSEHNGVGGLLIRSTGTSNSSQNARSNIFGLWCENTPVGIEIRGTGGVSVFNSYYSGNGRFVKITQDTTLEGRYSSENLIYAHHNSVEIEHGNLNNFLYVHRGTPVFDYDGRNSINSFGRAGTEIQVSSNYDCITYLNNTLPTGATRDSVQFSSGSILSQPLSYSSSKGYSGHLQVTPKDNPFMDVANVTIAMDTLYFYLLLQAEANSSMSLTVDNIDSSKIYDFREEKLTKNGSPFPILATGDLQYHRIRMIHTGGRIIGRLYFGTWASFLMSPVARIYYINLSDDPDCGLIHKRNGEIVGYGFNQSIFTDSNRPSANKFVPGTQIWNTTVDSLQISDGSEWLNR